MGGAGLSLINGIDALFINPANLNTNEGIVTTILSPSITSNRTAYDVISNYASLTQGDTLRDYIQPHLGKQYGFNVGNVSGIAVKNFAAAFIIEGVMYQKFSNMSFPELNLNSYYHWSIKIGGSWGFFKDEMLKIGGAIKHISRHGLQDTATTETLLSLSNNELIDWVNRKGRAYGMDLGVTFDIPTGGSIVKPSIALVWQDLFTTSFVGSGLSAGKIPDNLSLGLGATIKLPALDLKTSIDFKHLTDRGISVPLKIHMGVEAVLPMLTLRGGLNQGYYTAGVSFNLFFFDIEVSTYGEEIGSYPGQKQDRRYTLKFTSTLSLFN
jgi:hypothetical protein